MKKLVLFLMLSVLSSFIMLNAQVLLASANSNKSQTIRLETNLTDCDLNTINFVLGKKLGLATKAEPCPTCPPVKTVIPTLCKKVVHKKICAATTAKVKSNGVVILNNNIVINNNGNSGSNSSNDAILAEIKDLKSKFGSYQDFTKANDQHDKDMAALKMQLKYQSYKTSGWVKIVGGLLSQTTGVGLVVWANNPIIKTRSVVTTYEKDVTHIEYDLQELPLELSPATIKNGAGAGKSLKSSMFSGIKKCGTAPTDNPVTPPSEPPVVPPVVVIPPVVVVVPPVVVVEPVIVTPVVVTPVVVTPVIVTPQPIDNSNHSVDNSDHSVTNIDNSVTNIDNSVHTTINVTHKYVLVPHTVTEKLSFTVESQETYKASRNKTAFYLGAGALFICGGILEASGISDFGKAHNIKLTLNQNFMQSMNYGQSSNFSSKNLFASTQLGLRITF